MSTNSIFGFGKKMFRLFYKKEVPQQLMNQKKLENFMKIKNPVEIALVQKTDTQIILSFTVKEMIKSVSVDSIWIDSTIVHNDPLPKIDDFIPRKETLMRKEDFEANLDTLYSQKGSNLTNAEIQDEIERQYQEYADKVNAKKQKYLKYDGKKFIDGRDNQITIQFIKKPKERGIIQVFASFEQLGLKKSIINYVNYA